MNENLSPKYITNSDDIDLYMTEIGKRLDKLTKDTDWEETKKRNPKKKTRNKKRTTIITHEYIADIFNIERWRIDKYLLGLNSIDAITLLNFCKLFDCESGYILGEFDEKKRKDADVKKATGLSPEALNELNQNKDSIIYEKTVWDNNDTEVTISTIDANDTLPVHSKYSDVLNSILIHHPELVSMLGRILYCKELKLEHYGGDKFISGLQQNAQSGIIQNNTFEMCMGLAMYLYHLSEGENISPSFSVTENFNFAQEYISNHVRELTKENTYLKNEIDNMEQDSGYQFGARPY